VGPVNTTQDIYGKIGEISGAKDTFNRHPYYQHLTTDKHKIVLKFFNSPVGERPWFVWSRFDSMTSQFAMMREQFCDGAKK
jgi:hypothetical protein